MRLGYFYVMKTKLSVKRTKFRIWSTDLIESKGTVDLKTPLG